MRVESYCSVLCNRIGATVIEARHIHAQQVRVPAVSLDLGDLSPFYRQHDIALKITFECHQ